ncbi:MAG: pyridoxamine 5'-phosphate oxidase family protein [Deltaproteobacteria bacterium]|nr:pyridoxamine 5'-phosphate oxidase family protein [Deltaproteobacteria bacterium]
MTKTEILEFLNANPICYLATAENSRPHVRALGMVRADEQGLLFQTVEGKDLSKQLKQNPEVEVCFFDREKNMQVRVQGKAVAVDDLELKKEIIEKRPFLKPWVEKNGLAPIFVFRVVDGQALVWTMALNFAPKEYVRL